MQKLYTIMTDTSYMLCTIIFVTVFGTHDIEVYTSVHMHKAGAEEAAKIWGGQNMLPGYICIEKNYVAMERL